MPCSLCSLTALLWTIASVLFMARSALPFKLVLRLESASFSATHTLDEDMVTGWLLFYMSRKQSPPIASMFSTGPQGGTVGMKETQTFKHKCPKKKLQIFNKIIINYSFPNSRLQCMNGTKTKRELPAQEPFSPMERS